MIQEFHEWASQNLPEREKKRENREIIGDVVMKNSMRNESEDYDSVLQKKRALKIGKKWGKM